MTKQQDEIQIAVANLRSLLLGASAAVLLSLDTLEQAALHDPALFPLLPAVLIADNFTDVFTSAPLEATDAAQASIIYRRRKSRVWEVTDHRTGAGNATAVIKQRDAGGITSVMSHTDHVAYSQRVFCPEGFSFTFPGVYQFELSHSSHLIEGRGWFDWFFLRGDDENLINPAWKEMTINPFAVPPGDGVDGFVWGVTRKSHDLDQFDKRSPVMGIWDKGNFRYHRHCKAGMSYRDNSTWQPSDLAYEDGYGQYLQGTAQDAAKRTMHEFRAITDGTIIKTFERPTPTLNSPSPVWKAMLKHTFAYPLQPGAWMAMFAHQWYGSQHSIDYLNLCANVHAAHDTKVTAIGHPELIMRESDFLDRQRHTFEMDIANFRVTRLAQMR